MNADAPVVFLHLPKAGGMALRAALRAALKPERVVSGYGRVLFGDFEAFDDFAPDLRRQVFLRPDDFDLKADLVMGHFAFAELQYLYPQGRFLIVLREPRSRLLSQWRYERAVRAHASGRWGAWLDRTAGVLAPFGDYLNDPSVAFQNDNLLVRMLTWPSAATPPDRFIDPAEDAALLKEARGVLAGFGHVGLLEAPSLEEDLASFLGVSFTMERRNEAGEEPAPAFNPDDPALTAALHARTRLDRVLWAEVVAARADVSGAQSLAETSWATCLRRHRVSIAAF